MFTLADLEAIVAQRAAAGAENSYTAGLLRRGKQHCARKFGEESIEAMLAAVSGSRDELRRESADVLYHLLVLLRASGVGLDEVMEELRQRTAQSGLTEKASRASAEER